MFLKNIFITNVDVGVKASEMSYSCPFVSKYSTIFPVKNNNKILQIKVFTVVKRYHVPPLSNK